MQTWPRSLLALGLLASLLAGCAVGPADQGPFTPPRRQIDQIVDDTVEPGPDTLRANPIAVFDPFERTNRAIYKFNAQLDRYVLIPVVDTYTMVTPELVRTGVGNFFKNIGEIPTFANSAMQGKVEKAVPTMFRFALNSTLGVFGLFDVAGELGIRRQQEDFGQTLGFWGAGNGPYIVLPALGPSNLRDTTGTGVDFVIRTLALSQLPDDVQDSVFYDVAFYGLQPIDSRYQNSFRYHSTGSPFEYDLVRYFVTETRQLQILN